MLASLAAVAVLQIAPTATGVVLPAEQTAYEARMRSVALESATLFTGEACVAAVVSPVRSETLMLADRPDLPAMLQRVRVEGCGRSSIQNMSVVREAGAANWLITAEHPGETRIVPQQLEALLPQIMQSVFKDLPARCGRPYLDDTYVAAGAGQVGFNPSDSEGAVVSLDLPTIAANQDLDHAAAWMEVWMYRACGQSRPLGLILMPTKQGGLATYPIPFWTMISDNSDLPARVTP